MNLHRSPREIASKAVLYGARKLLGPFGIAAVPAEVARPCAWGSRRVLGSFPPSSELFCVGDRKNYFIHEGYEHRKQAIYFDDTQNTEGSQQEIYQFAQEICQQKGMTTVYDIGCGSAYKLMKYLGGFKTVGVDVPKTCRWLRQRYPDRIWKELDSLSAPNGLVDLLIASDVIEHLIDPDQLLTTIANLHPRYIILSTPDRNLLRAGTHNGPPLNPAHIREWNFAEFEAYVKSYFEIIEHFISSAPQATQCVFCRPKDTQ